MDPGACNLLDAETLAELEGLPSPDAVVEALRAAMAGAAEVLNARDADLNTPLHVAARSGCVEVCR